MAIYLKDCIPVKVSNYTFCGQFVEVPCEREKCRKIWSVLLRFGEGWQLRGSTRISHNSTTALSPPPPPCCFGPKLSAHNFPRTGRRDFLFSQVCCCHLLLSSTGRWLSRRCLPSLCLLALPRPQQQCHAHPRASIQTQRHAPPFYDAQALERATDTSVLQAPGAICSLSDMNCPWLKRAYAQVRSCHQQLQPPSLSSSLQPLSLH